MRVSQEQFKFVPRAVLATYEEVQCFPRDYLWWSYAHYMIKICTVLWTHYPHYVITILMMGWTVYTNYVIANLTPK